SARMAWLREQTVAVRPARRPPRRPVGLLAGRDLRAAAVRGCNRVRSRLYDHAAHGTPRLMARFVKGLSHLMAHRPRLTFLLTGAAAVLLLAVPALGARAAGPQAPVHATVQVGIQNFAFSPRTLVIAAGTTVVWTNRDMAPHTVTSDTNAWMASARLDAGQSFSLTFSNPGTYTYHCAVHPFMTATVIVRGATQAPPAPRRRPSSRQTVLLRPLGGSGVSGSALVSYSAASGRTTILVTVRHPRPGTVHPVHPHAGSDCTANRPILATFVPLGGMDMAMGPRADGSGTLRGRTTIADSVSGKTWHINVHTGPGLATLAQFRILACGILR
ncbi:MAG: cupredoxin domain-containing protein, partial [Chloroflexota bacterium]